MLSPAERDELCFAPAGDLVTRMARRELRAGEVMAAYLSRIDEVDGRVNSIVTRLEPEQLLEEARTLDEAAARGGTVGPLHGLPIAHKDMVATRGIRTTMGSPLFRNHVPDHDALLVERVHAAGAITIGKTNTPEFAAGANTFNTVFGATRNPYNLAKTCGGSSGGAAAAVAAGLLPLADGSDLGGSLRIPAGFCNVVGLRPSIGRVPAWPRQAAWTDLVTEGPIARTVGDAALLLSVMAGPDDRDPTAIAESGDRFRRPLGRDFKGARVAWGADLGCLPLEPAVRAAVDGVRADFATLGCVVENAYPDLAGADEVFQVLRAFGMALSLGELLESQPGSFKATLADNIQRGIELTAREVQLAEVRRTEIYHRLRVFFDEYDFLVLPTNQVLPFDVEVEFVTEIDGSMMDTYIDFFKSCYIFSATGLPCISVPCGFSADGLPVGAQIVGRHHDDFGVLQLAHAFEQVTGHWRRRPTLVQP